MEISLLFVLLPDTKKPIISTTDESNLMLSPTQSICDFPREGAIDPGSQVGLSAGGLNQAPA